MQAYGNALLGGVLIGVASVLMLLLNGKILGVSGIVGGMLRRDKESKAWRYLFLGGILAGGAVLELYAPNVFSYDLKRSPATLIVAGLLVGYGTRLGNGCTSGHGICGVSRVSPRSLMATLTFIFMGGVTVFVINRLLGANV